jgi:HSP20 family molecular chaperone IbpA
MALLPRLRGRAGLLAAVSIITLAGCGSQTDNASGDTDTVRDDPSETTSAPTSEPAAEPTESEPTVEASTSEEPSEDPAPAGLEGRLLTTAELPGVRKDDIQVTIDGSQVTLAAEVKREKEASQDERVLHAERVYGKVSRSFTLPQEVDEAKAEAKFRDGVLELKLPKKAAAQRKQISIQ